MDCKDIQDNLSAFMDQELALAAEESIRVHLGECDQCALQYAKLLKGWQALDAWDDVTPPDRMQRKVLDSVKPQRHALSLRRVLYAAAVLLLVFGTAVYYSGQKERLAQDHLAGSKSPVQTATVGDISEDEIIANLLILQEEDFFEVLDELVKIDELPLAEEPSSPTKEPARSSLDIVLT